MEAAGAVLRIDHGQRVQRSGSAPGAESGRRLLRVGLFCDTPFQPRWIGDSFVTIAGSDFADIVVIGEGGELGDTEPLLLRAYRKADARRYGAKDDLSERLDLRAYFPHARRILSPAWDSARHFAAWRKELEGLRLDVVFLLGKLDSTHFDGLARHGVWRYCFGEEHHTDERIAGYHEVAEGRPVTGSGLLVRWKAGEPDQLVIESWSRTLAHSVSQNRNNCLRKTSQFAYRALRDLSQHGAEWIGSPATASPIAGAPARRAGEAPAIPTSTELVRHGARIGLTILRRRIRDLCRVNQWYIGYRFDEDGPWKAPLNEYYLLSPPRDRYWADPFPYEREGRYFIFLEEILLGQGHGYLSMVEVDRDGRSSVPRPVLQRDYHLSYPNILEQDGELFLVPESGQNRTVEVYRCIAFPDRWQLEKVLLRGIHASDPTFHHDGERWWMFVVASLPGADPYDELHLYYSDRLLGEWIPHERNPVKSDVRSARPAGRLFERNGVLYRPGQVCAPHYGAAVSINQVLRLSTEAYAEVEVDRILPPAEQGALGLHTVNRSAGLSVYDAFVPRWRHAFPRAR